MALSQPVGGNPYDALIAELESERDALRNRVSELELALKDVDDLIGSSRGVSGLHLNGDDAPWADLRTGGPFQEWLVRFDAALNPEL